VARELRKLGDVFFLATHEGVYGATESVPRAMTTTSVFADGHPGGKVSVER